MPEVAFPLIDEDDVAAIAAAILLGGGHDEEVLDVTGTQPGEPAKLVGATWRFSAIWRFGL